MLGGGLASSGRQTDLKLRGYGYIFMQDSMHRNSMQTNKKHRHIGDV